MGQRCSICKHDKRLEVDRDIVNNIPHTKIAKTYGVSNQSVRNHAKNHLSRQMIKHVRIREMLHADDLLSNIKALVKKTETILKKSEKEGKYMISLAAIRELRSTYEFMCKIAKYLDERQKEEVPQESDEQEEIRKQLDRLDILSDEELDLMERLLQKMDGEDIDVISVTNEELSMKQKMNPKHKFKLLANEEIGKSKKKE